MSSGVDVRRTRPGIWSYFSFSGPRRRISVSLPRSEPSNNDDDPFEKPDRHSRLRSTSMNDYKTAATMNGGQRARYLKTGGIIAFVLLVLYFIAPRDGLTRASGSWYSASKKGGMLTSAYRSSFERAGQHGRSRCRASIMHQVLLKGQAAYPICADDRCWQHGLAHPRLQVQQLRPDPRTREGVLQDDGEEGGRVRPVILRR